MPTTTNFGWTTPADTDLVKDGAAAIRTLGNGIDTSLLDLKGGTTGQILSKASNTDLDYAWINNDQGDLTAVSAGVGITVTNETGPIPTITNSSTDLITTAGDILYGTAADTVARLGIGTAGQVLRVNSGATAPEWATPAGAGGMDLITTEVPSSASGTAFTSISSDYKQLILIWTGIDATDRQFGIRFNSDTAGNYQVFGYNNVDQGGATNASGGTSIFGSGGASSTSSNGYLIIQNANSSSYHKQFQIGFSYYDNSPGRVTQILTGYYSSTTRISQIDVYRFSGAATYTARSGAAIQLFGVK